MPAIVVTARDIRITARQRGYVEDKLEGLQKYFVGLKKLEAVVEQSGEEVEIHLRVSVTGGKSLVCSARAKKIYQAVSLQEAETHLEAFAQTWDAEFPTIGKAWREHWAHLTPFFAFPQDIRRVIYTTNAIESLNSTLRKIIKTRRGLPSEEMVTKLLYLTLQNIAKSGPNLSKDGGKPSTNLPSFSEAESPPDTSVTQNLTDPFMKLLVWFTTYPNGRNGRND